MSVDIKVILRSIYWRIKKSILFFEEQGRVTVDENHGIHYLGLDYPIYPLPRYGYGKPPHPRLYDLINANRSRYRTTLESFLQFAEFFSKIPVKESENPAEPNWVNDYLPPLDGLALYSLLALRRPSLFLEVGSGNSTRFARRAILDHGLPTRIISIDPEPRAEIDPLCDQVIRTPLEKSDLEVFTRLEPGDFLFIDNSHRVFTNSDVTVTFLEILPDLKPGVVVQIHDVLLPYDYPLSYSKFYYSEQYMLAVWLLARNDPDSILLPNTFIYGDPELSKVLSPIWQNPALAGVETNGCSFWLTSG